MLLNQLKEHWRIIIISLILIVNLIFQVQSINSLLPTYFQVTYLSLILSIVYILLEASDKIKSSNENKEVKTSIQEIDQKLTSLSYFEEQRTKKRNLVKPLIDLINHNIISIKSVEDIIKGKNFICIFCYQTQFTSNVPQKMKDNKKVPHRRYNELLEKLGFIKLASKYTYYIIAEDNLYPESLRNIDVLGNYLINKGQECANEEWNIILEYSKHEAPRFYDNRVNSPNPINFNFLIQKINAKDVKHDFLIQNDFNPMFNIELATIASIREIYVNEKEKVEIKNFVLKSSLNILIGDLPRDQREILLSLEPEFKKLGIKHIYDYHKASQIDLINIINTKIDSKDLSERLTAYIMDNSRNYEDTLLELGIHLD